MAVSVAEPPGQTVWLLAVNDGVGITFTNTVVLLKHDPFDPVTV